MSKMDDAPLLLHRPGVEASDYAFIWNREGTERSQRTGGVRQCRLESCSGLRIGTRWPDGKVTWPCTEGLTQRPDGDWQISG